MLFRKLFIKNKFTLINIVGLSIGLTISLLILLYIRYETSFERFNPNASNVYRIVEKNYQDGSIGAATPVALTEVLKTDFPEIDELCGIIRTWDDISVQDKKYDSFKGSIVDKNFFTMFNLPLIMGNQTTLFDSPYEVVITRTTANKLFGEDNPLGNTIEYEGHLFTITGLINDIPSNSIFNFDYLLAGDFRHISYPDLNERWYEFGLFTFITFHGNNVPVDFEGKLAGIEPVYYPDFMKNRFEYLVMPFKGSHLNSELRNDITAAVSSSYLWILVLVSIGILIIACLNFVNISLASSSKRNVATGIKKVNGASSKMLIFSHLSEIGIVVFIGLVISFMAVILLMPTFVQIVEKPMEIDFFDPVLWIGTLMFCLLTILLSGLYPSFVLSRPSSLKLLLKKNISPGKFNMQKGFVVIQFALTIVLTVALFFIHKQVRYMQNHDIGFDQTNLITIPVYALGNNSNEALKKTKILVQELEKHKAQFGYSKASITEFVPGFGYRNLFKIFAQNSPFPNGLELLSCDIDEAFLEVYDMQMIEGRFFSNEYPTDYNAVILNETAWKKLKWENLEGKQINLFTPNNPKKVVGVINDINVRSLQYPVSPMIYQFGRHHNFPGYVSLRLNNDNKGEAIDFIKQKWIQLFPEIPFEYQSVEEKFNAAYGDEKRIAKIIGIFSLLAMALSMLGVFALSAIQFEKRIKEVGVRKVSGAKIFEIVRLLNLDFARWVIIAFIIAVPLAWLATDKLLNSFAYKTEISWWVFALAGTIALVIALITVSWQSWVAAVRNPVEALRYE